MGSPYKKDSNILESTLGSPYSGKLPFRVWGLGLSVPDEGFRNED